LTFRLPDALRHPIVSDRRDDERDVVAGVAQELFRLRSVARRAEHGLPSGSVQWSRIGSSRPWSTWLRSRSGRHASERRRIAPKKPVHQGCGNALPSLVFSKIGACLSGAVERPSLIALKRATIAVIALCGFSSFFRGFPR
jgi:hypothetical protein